MVRLVFGERWPLRQEENAVVNVFWDISSVECLCDYHVLYKEVETTHIKSTDSPAGDGTSRGSTVVAKLGVEK